MKVKELIQQVTPLKKVCNNPPILQSDDSVHQAFQKFLKSKAHHLEVFEDGIFIGTIPLISLLESIMNDYQKEREKHYQLNKGLNHSLTKIKNLIEKINNTKSPVTRKELMEKIIGVIDSAQRLLV